MRLKSEIGSAVEVVNRALACQGRVGDGELGEIVWAMEDFILRPSHRGTADRVGISPARLGGMIQGLIVGRELGWKVVLQQPAEAMSYVTDERLRRWGLWVKGRGHSRDAMRHAVLACARLGGYEPGVGEVCWWDA